MKHIAKKLGIAAFATFLITSNPTIAQSAAPQNTADSRTDDRDHDDTGKWGLVGLLGLIGLVGLKAKDKDYRNHNTATTNR